jgi:hypothetical protein
MAVSQPFLSRFSAVEKALGGLSSGAVAAGTHTRLGYHARSERGGGQLEVVTPWDAARQQRQHARAMAAATPRTDTRLAASVCPSAQAPSYGCGWR